ncbi:histidine phosphatase family protein [Microvirga alba]|uniref:Histidine phosphatase family protein n=1 Tax=Microvirga alba TaxID=2791025 RepID=A0A931FRL4_9HYPH|nr:histidine phosphatase family protein [Microvirga alba]MBF9232866.1 histidine phosphatase family protein [Microvirga alba]
MPKIVHCIRHGQSTFNAQYALTGTDPLHFDATLSDLGHQQVAETAPKVRDTAYELIVTSPLTRAIQTTLGIFKNHPSASQIRVEGLHRERLENSCDVGRAPAMLIRDFPGLAFDHLEDVWWHKDGEPDERGFVVEPPETVITRAALFREWLSARPERLIAVVGHGTFFYHLTGQRLQNCEIATLEM